MVYLVKILAASIGLTTATTAASNWRSQVNVIAVTMRSNIGPLLSSLGHVLKNGLELDGSVDVEVARLSVFQHSTARTY